MRGKLWKAFWDFEKEEAWLNDMAAKGIAMTDYSICRYTFEECEPGEYEYRIELLEKSPKSHESVAYLRFLKESGIEAIAFYNSWAYFR
ncbi:MAG: DUF2812 domain-containing protein [Clostridiales bacterium]|jgi:hypothetical protein|nr:DUF2812 domain-containing protein [Clostridiales bacterium]